MELTDIEVRQGTGNSIEAELRADAAFGDRGCTVSIVGWGATDTVAREQVEAAMAALGLSVEKSEEAMVEEEESPGAG